MGVCTLNLHLTDKHIVSSRRWKGSWRRCVRGGGSHQKHRSAPFHTSGGDGSTRFSTKGGAPVRPGPGGGWPTPLRLRNGAALHTAGAERSVTRARWLPWAGARNVPRSPQCWPAEPRGSLPAPQRPALGNSLLPQERTERSLDMSAWREGTGGSRWRDVSCVIWGKRHPLCAAVSPSENHHRDPPPGLLGSPTVICGRALSWGLAHRHPQGRF